jgi:cytochrome c551/c552
MNPMKRLPCSLTLVALVTAVWCLPALAQQPAPPRFSREDIVFFEEKVRPLLHNQCLTCHSREKKTSGLSLESRAETLAGGNRGPAAEPGKPDHSRLLQVLTFTGDVKMPPTGQLKPEEIALFKRWVEAGLPWPEDRATQAAQQTPSTHWSFQPLKQFSEPLLKDKAWGRNIIDKLVLARLEKEGLKPSPEADKVTLIRRLSLDLLGLPPAPAEVDSFLSDKRPDAYDRLVDRLLASPHYGERWARHWLDVARYADTNGFGFDRARVMWRYRDWVIRALNQDMPFDQFVIEQLAGDLLPNATLDQKIATGFHRNTMINEEGGVDQEQYRIEAVFDRVKTTGAAFLGLTAGCAQCHDHKYDPISQREFYQLFAFFNNQDEPSLQIVRPGQVDEYRKISAGYDLEKLRLQSDIARRSQEIVALLPAWENKLTVMQRQGLPSNIQAILKMPPAERELAHVDELEKFYKENDKEYQARLRALDQFLETPSAGNPNQFTAMVLQERETPRPTHILIRGDFLKHGVKVSPGVPAVLPPLEKPDRPEPSRLDLARWLVSEKNPLTARVTVNRVWQRYFGKGLVKTVEDFGTQGDKPSHPELLDWLAAEFTRQRWSQKALHRLIVTSATYRQSSKVTPGLKERDPENLLLARSPRLRVEAEIVRDIALTASGLIQHRVGGPSVLPPQPAGITDLSRGNLIWVTATGPDRYRRGMYTFWKRTSPYPGLTVFDAPTADEATVQRIRSNTPLQALTTLNDEVFVEAAQALALRVIREAKPDDRARLRYGFRLCLAREPDSVEDATLWNILNQERERFRQKPETARALVPEGAPADVAPAQYASWFNLARVLLNLDETITRE